MNFPLLENKHTLFSTVDMQPTHIYVPYGYEKHIDANGGTWERWPCPGKNLGQWALTDEAFEWPGKGKWHSVDEWVQSSLLVESNGGRDET